MTLPIATRSASDLLGTAVIPTHALRTSVRRFAAAGGAVFLVFLLATCSGEGPTQPKQVATQLAFVVSPASTAAGTAFSPAIQVAILDAAGKQVAGFADSVHLTIETNPGSGTLS